jgi:hypothetical protein
MMSRFTDAERARILAESRRILSDEPPARPEPAPEPPREVHVQFEDEVQKWAREADEADARRAAAKAELRREEGDNARALTAIERITALEQRIAELEQSVATSDAMSRELAQGTVTFSQAVNQGLARMDVKLAELSGKLTEMRCLEDARRGQIIDLPDFRRRAH